MRDEIVGALKQLQAIDSGRAVDTAREAITHGQQAQQALRERAHKRAKLNEERRQQRDAQQEEFVKTSIDGNKQVRMWAVHVNARSYR